MACQGGDLSKAGVTAGKGGAAGGKAAAAAAKPAGKGATAAATPASVTLDEEGAMRMVQAVLSAKPKDKSVAEQMLRDALTKVRIKRHTRSTHTAEHTNTTLPRTAILGTCLTTHE